MKKSIIFSLSILIISEIALVTSCKKEEPKPNGKIVFWQSSSKVGGSFTSITFDGAQVGDLNYYFYTKPNCDNQDAVTVSKPAGSYNFVATGQNNMRWSGVITIESNQCKDFEFTEYNYSYKPSGTTSSGTTSSGTSSSGTTSSGTSSSGTTSSGSTSSGSTSSSGTTSSGTSSSGTSSSGTTSSGSTSSGSTSSSGTTSSGTSSSGTSSSGTSSSGSTTNYATFTIWTSCSNCSDISVYVDDEAKGVLNKYYTSTPNCGALSAVNVYNLPYGSHKIYASNSSYTWGPSYVNIQSSCFTYELYSSTSSSSSSSGSTSSSSSSGSTSTGKGIFWSDFNSSPIDVYLQGSFIGTITKYSTTIPECETSGYVTFTKSPGTYSYTAKEQAGGSNLTWSGSITITSNSCSSMNLTCSNCRKSETHAEGLKTLIIGEKKLAK